MSTIGGLRPRSCWDRRRSGSWSILPVIRKFGLDARCVPGKMRQTAEQHERDQEPLRSHPRRVNGELARQIVDSNHYICVANRSHTPESR